VIPISTEKDAHNHRELKGAGELSVGEPRDKPMFLGDEVVPSSAQPWTEIRVSTSGCWQRTASWSLGLARNAQTFVNVLCNRFRSGK
jgi:hypothetical protein